MFYENAFQNIATVTPLSRVDCIHKSSMICFWQHLDSSKIMLKLCWFLWITLPTIAIEVWLFSKLETKQFEQRQNSDCWSVLVRFQSCAVIFPHILTSYAPLLTKRPERGNFIIECECIVRQIVDKRVEPWVYSFCKCRWLLSEYLSF